MKTAQSAHAQKNDSAMMLKLSLLAAAAVVSDASAAIIAAKNLPIACPSGGEDVYWDVDGGGYDFKLQKTIYNAIITGYGYNSFLRKQLLPGKLKQLHTNTGSLISGKTVGKFGQFFQSQFILTHSGDVGTQAPDWAKGEAGYFGFKFKGADNGIHYGWGFMTIYGNTGTHPYEITLAYYNDVPSESIKVGLPEPSSLALLALGAAGVAAWRARRIQA